MGQTEGTWLAYDLPAPVTIDHLDLALVADGRHSVPTRLRVEAGGQAREVDVPPVTDSRAENAVARAGALPTAHRRPAARHRRAGPEGDDARLVLRLASGAAHRSGRARRRRRARRPPPDTFPGGCRTDLLTVDGRPVGIRVTGTRDQAEGRQGLAVEACGPDAGGMTLGAGPHELRTRAGRDTGIDVDRLVLDSAGAGAGSSQAGPGPQRPQAAPAPPVDVVHEGRTSYDLRVRDATRPFWLVLGQSHNRGWTATGGGRSLGPPQLVNGYANGWYVRPHAGRRSIDIHLEWTPQRRVWWALALSAVGVAICFALALVDPRRGATR